ncbi:MAG: protein-L-isoaspartate O-methyltransferase family protein [Thermoprotei archaeon]
MISNVYERERNRMVDILVQEGFIKSQAVEQAMRRVPRHRFVAKGYETVAYEDAPFPTENGQTTSAPSIIAIMCEAALPFSLMFEVGCGYGYLASVCALAQPNGKIITAELYENIATHAAKNFTDLGIDDRVTVIVFDGSLGPPLNTQPDTIIISAAAPEVPHAVFEKLAEDGKMIVPVGTDVQELLLVKKKKGAMITKPLIPCIFVPMQGTYGAGHYP